MKKTAFLLLWLGAAAFWEPQKAFAQPGIIVPGATNFFEGNITYSFETTGEIAQTLEYINNIKFMTFIVKDGNFIIHLYGKLEDMQPRAPGYDPENPIPDLEAKLKQVFPTTRLFCADSNRTYVIDGKNNRAFRKDSYEPGESEIPFAVPLGDSLKIAGFMCYGYKVQKAGEEIIHYVTPKIRVNMKFYGGKSKARHAFMTHGLDGCIPLKTVRKNKERVLTVTATKVTAQKLQIEQFTIPKEFKILNRDYRR